MIKPSDLNGMKNPKFYCIFGMAEMEWAAIKIVEKCKIRDTWETCIDLSDFDGEKEQNGYLHLVMNGWIKRGNYNNEFKVNGDFIERVWSHKDLEWKEQ